jgi:hypothetical protein
MVTAKRAKPKKPITQSSRKEKAKYSTVLKIKRVSWGETSATQASPTAPIMADAELNPRRATNHSPKTVPSSASQAPVFPFDSIQLVRSAIGSELPSCNNTGKTRNKRIPR